MTLAILKRRLARLSKQWKEDARHCRQVANRSGDDTVSLMMMAYAIAYGEAATKVSRAIGQHKAKRQAPATSVIRARSPMSKRRHLALARGATGR